MNETKSSSELIKMCKEICKDTSNYINITELLKLTNVGIPLNDLTWSRTKMSVEHCICVRHTSIRTSSCLQNKSELNGQYNGRAKFFLNEDELSSSLESRKDYDKYSNGRNSISSDDSAKYSQSKLKKNSFNSKLRLTNEKATFFLGNNLSLYKSEDNLDNNLNANLFGRQARSKMIKSNSFNNIINSKMNGTYRCNTENYSINNAINQCNNTSNSLDVPPQFQFRSRSKTQFASILFLINPYDARISRFEVDYVKIAQLNPIRTFLAVATNYTVHTISIRSCKVIATTRMEENIEYITWLTPVIIAIVTSRTVYHWDLSIGNNQPMIVFFKSPKMYNCQIVNYEADVTMTWFALSSLCLEEDEKTITGIVQVHHHELQNEQSRLSSQEMELDLNNNNCFQQCIEAHSVTFARIKFDENNLESTTLIAIKKTSTNTCKIYIIELGPLNQKNNCLISRTEILRFNDNVNGQIDKIDLPIHNVICMKLSLIYIISKYGRLIICDLQTGLQINEQQIVCEDLILSAKLDIDNQSIILISRNGQVLLIEFNFHCLIKQFANDTKLKKIAKRILFALDNVNDEVTRL